MSKDSFKEEYNLLVDELTHILNSQEIVNELQNQNVVIELLKSIKICEFLEDKLDILQSERKSLSFLKILAQYYAISNVHVDSYYYIDETTLSDDVNYLKVFSKNILHKDYKDLTPRNTNTSESFKQSNNAHKATFDRNTNNTSFNDKNDNIHKNSEEIDSENYDYINQNNNSSNNNQLFGNFFNNFFGYGYNANSLGVGASPEDQMAAAAANQRLNKEILSGKLYIYKTKPKIIPILKFITGIFSIFIIVVIIAQIALNQSISSLLIPQDSPLYNYLGLNSVNSNLLQYLGLSPNNVHVGNIMYSGLVSSWFWAIFLIIVFAYQMYIQLKPAKNENDKYFMRIGWLLFETFFILIYFISDFTSFSIQRVMFGSWEAWHQTYLAYDGGKYLSLVTAVYAFAIIYVVLLCSFIVLGLSGWLLKPKQDFDYLNKVYQTYFDQARRQISDQFGR